MEFLVSDLLYLIFDYLPLTNLVKIRQVSKRWRRLINNRYDNSEFKLIIQKRFDNSRYAIHIGNEFSVTRIEDYSFSMRDNPEYKDLYGDRIYKYLNKNEININLNFLIESFGTYRMAIMTWIGLISFEINNSILIIRAHYNYYGFDTETSILIKGNEFKILKLFLDIQKLIT